MKKLIFYIILLAGFLPLSAQDSLSKKEIRDAKREQRKQLINDLIRQDEEGVLVYSKQSLFGVQLQTNGYGVFFEMGKMSSQRTATIYSIGFSEIKHNKEEKFPSGSGGFSFDNPYIYGKINNFYQLKLGAGFQRILGQKGNKNGVAVNAILHGGLSLGLLRPYYIVVDDNGETRTIKYSQADSNLFIHGFILGGGGLGKGWGEMKMKPGVYAKSAMRFDFGRFNEVITAVEVGISTEFYSSKIPILLFQKNKQFFYQGHIAVMFGHRK